MKMDEWLILGLMAQWLNFRIGYTLAGPWLWEIMYIHDSFQLDRMANHV